MSALKIDRQTTTPFLLRLFYKNGSFFRPDDFAAPRLPPHLQIYTWQTCTLSELTHLLLSAIPALLPQPYTGTRVAFRLIFADTNGPSRPGMTPRYISRDLGSVIVGAEAVGRDDMNVDGGDVKEALKQLSGELEKTLHDARFVVGDYICAAILPPMEDGSVASPPPPAAGGSARGPPPRDFPSRGPPRENGFGRGGDYGYGRGGRGGGRFEDRRGGGVPSGEWRRGEAPPEREGGREGGYGRGGGGWGRGGGRGRGRW